MRAHNAPHSIAVDVGEQPAGEAAIAGHFCGWKLPWVAFSGSMRRGALRSKRSMMARVPDGGSIRGHHNTLGRRAIKK